MRAGRAAAIRFHKLSLSGLSAAAGLALSVLLSGVCTNYPGIYYRVPPRGGIRWTAANATNSPIPRQGILW